MAREKEEATPEEAATALKEVGMTGRGGMFGMTVRDVDGAREFVDSNGEVLDVSEAVMRWKAGIARANKTMVLMPA